jgi:hypothetical protein
VRKLLFVLALLAVTLAGLAAVVLKLPLEPNAPQSAALVRPAATLDHYSFMLGLFTGAFVVWIVRMPLSAVQYMLLRWKLGWKFHWRRRVALVGIVAGAAVMLIFY